MVPYDYRLRQPWLVTKLVVLISAGLIRATLLRPSQPPVDQGTITSAQWEAKHSASFAQTKGVGVLSTHSIQTLSGRRSYLLHTPPSLAHPARQVRVPLILMLHGAYIPAANIDIIT